MSWWLWFEQVFQGSARLREGRIGGIRTGFDEYKEITVIRLMFLADKLCNRLAALLRCCAIMESAVVTAMKIGSAGRTLISATDPGRSDNLLLARVAKFHSFTIADADRLDKFKKSSSAALPRLAKQRYNAVPKCPSPKWVLMKTTLDSHATLG
ncbi:MAG TPA: hypothetical protein VL197_08160 [Nitrospirota bacterium]|nr:hypothetical protein [Nitrospirota bacterium]